MSIKTRIIFPFATAAIVFMMVCLLGELILRMFNPQVTMYPRWKFSPDYGFMLYENSKITHERLGHWKFTYGINRFQYRGRPVPISNAYDKENIVILGDSHSFGMGVNDGEEYASSMAKNLQSQFNVINLAVGAWGLAQEIRRFYEFGQLYLPKVVLLQFCGNDPADNFNNQVVRIENGNFVFQESNSSINWIKKYLSRSLIQKSQVYNLFRDTIYWLFQRRIVNKAEQAFASNNRSGVPPEEIFYNELLELFASDLNGRGIQLMMIAVNGDLNEYPHIKKKVIELDSRDLLDYYEVEDFFEGIKDFGSPEGHIWGKVGHKVLGDHLTEIVKINYGLANGTSLKNNKTKEVLE